MKKTLWALIVSGFVCLPVQAANLKLGVVSVEALLKNAPQVQVINQKMQERFTAPQQELSTLGESIKAAQEKLKKDELILSKQQKADAQKNLLEQIKSYREKESELKREVDTVRNQALAEFRYTVQKVLNELAEAKGYDFIFSEGVAFAKKEYDLTEEVLKRLNDQDKKDKK